MNVEELQRVAFRAVADHVTVDLVRQVKSLKPDVSAIAPEHALGFKAGFHAAKVAMIMQLETEA